MADPIWRPSKCYFSRIFMKIFTTGFFGWLITNLMSDFQNPRWRIRNQLPKKSLSKYFHQYSWRITFRCLPCWIRYLGFWKSNVKIVTSDPKCLLSPNFKLLSWIDSSKMNFFEKCTIFFSLFIYKSNIISKSANLTVSLCYFITLVSENSRTPDLNTLKTIRIAKIKINEAVTCSINWNQSKSTD